MAKLTPEQLAIDRELKRINAQIKAAYTKLGAESRLARQYESIMMPGTKQRDRLVDKQVNIRGVQQPLIQYKNGIPQISRSKAAINAIQTTPLANDIMQLGRMQTVQAAQKAMIRAYEKRTGQEVKTKAEKAAAIAAEMSEYKTAEKTFAETMQKIYAIEERRGIRFKSHDQIKAMSKGYWTSKETLSEMQQLADKILADEKAAVVGDLLEGF